MRKLFVFLFIIIVFIASGDQSFADNQIQVSKINNAAGRKIALEKMSSIFPKSIVLDVPLINQMDSPRLYNGCEVTSLAMLLNYVGVNVTKNELAAKVKKVPLDYGNGLKGNPNAGFVGDMENGPGLSVFNGPINDLAKEYAGDRVENLTNSPFQDLLKKVAQGHPVWIITTTTFTPPSFQVWNTPQGKVNITLQGHSVVITGYDDQYIYINDPYGYKNRKVEREIFIETWEKMGSQAITIEN